MNALCIWQSRHTHLLKVAIFFVCLVWGRVAFAQVGESRSQLDVGFNGGLAMNHISFDPTIKQKLHMGPTFGVTLRYTCEKYFAAVCALQIELNYARLGWRENIRSSADEPLPDIRIRSPWTVNYNDTTYTVREDTVYTDANGEFTYQTDCFQRGEYDIPLLIEDIDGEANGGSHAPDSVSVSFKDTELTGGDEWYLGRAEKEVNIRLKEK